MSLTQHTTHTTETIRDAILAKPDGILEHLAEEHGVSLRAVIDCLPDDSATAVAGSRFIDILSDVADWGDITFICHSKDAVVEFCGPFPKGGMGHGMYNLQGAKTGLSGHLRPERCAAIYFVRRPFMGLETMSIQFFNADGQAMFKIYVGRDEQRQLRADQVDRFVRLRAEMVTTDAS
ncbi:heme utilization cystosolic carrier protein HutX [Rhizobium sp. S-51]|uniref:Heme utilization cystosolic carrier protein HutX n=1 Tax=Rhizobium terricola TaxID=2728849 RepID=A0A7Y0AZ80_9HYPH|nr:heme utilization cystosolic carrier protein HutX [Rhizobium terricola]NML76226.1 heme utilization cystosolic carrier protein HutX [Rhizobium terricola]